MFTKKAALLLGSLLVCGAALTSTGCGGPSVVGHPTPQTISGDAPICHLLSHTMDQIKAHPAWVATSVTYGNTRLDTVVPSQFKPQGTCAVELWGQFAPSEYGKISVGQALQNIAAAGTPLKNFGSWYTDGSANYLVELENQGVRKVTVWVDLRNSAGNTLNYQITALVPYEDIFTIP